MTATGSEQALRGSVNGNVLVPLAGERTALATDPAVAQLVQRWIDAYPKALPNRTDIDPRALNTNAPLSIDTTATNLRLDQSAGANDRIFLQHSYTNQKLRSFQLVAGQNPDTNTKSHTARATWERRLGAAALLDVTRGAGPDPLAADAGTERSGAAGDDRNGVSESRAGRGDPHRPADHALPVRGRIPADDRESHSGRGRRRWTGCRTTGWNRRASAGTIISGRTSGGTRSRTSGWESRAGIPRRSGTGIAGSAGSSSSGIAGDEWKARRDSRCISGCGTRR